MLYVLCCFHSLSVRFFLAFVSLLFRFFLVFIISFNFLHLHSKFLFIYQSSLWFEWTKLQRLDQTILHWFNRFNIEWSFVKVALQVVHFIQQVFWLNLHKLSEMWIFLLLAFCFEEKIEIKFSNFFSSHTSDNERNHIYI